ncbi:class I SAM-dependent methyltransferase [bacterium]|nr:class I SAM-dependent methyltransferase [bacterium]
MEATFKDHFSKQSDLYAKFRPDYPKAMYEFILSHVQGRELAWDCGTGNGQVAAALVEYFDRVIATDPSAKQIEKAFHHDKIEYRIEPAEQTSLQNGTVDFVAVAQALHWFDFDQFYSEVRRVAKSKAIVAVWTYDLLKVNAEIDQIINHFYTEVVGSYWPKERRWVDEQYKTIPFPIDEFKAPEFFIDKFFNFEDFLGYLHTWSSVQQYIKINGQDPVDEIKHDLLTAWGNPGKEIPVRWPVYVRIGRV